MWLCMYNLKFKYQATRLPIIVVILPLPWTQSQSYPFNFGFCTLCLLSPPVMKTYPNSHVQHKPQWKSCRKRHSLFFPLGLSFTRNGGHVCVWVLDMLFNLRTQGRVAKSTKLNNFETRFKPEDYNNNSQPAWYLNCRCMQTHMKTLRH